MRARHIYRHTTGEIARLCHDIAQEYVAQGLRLTVRQLYYQIVARGLEDNGQNVYKRVVKALTDARIAGWFPMDLIEDRGRNVEGSSGRSQFGVDFAEEQIANDLRAGPGRHLWAGWWFAQPSLVSVWVEKEALSGVFEGPCGHLGAGLFACKGYPSISSLWDWIEKTSALVRHLGGDADAADALTEIGIDPADCYREVVVLYFGDHDPDGLEIPESCERSIAALLDAHGHTLPAALPPVRFERVALTLDQINAHNPPPFPAKQSSARYTKYVEQTGLVDAWELDALDPSVLRDLITANVRALHDAETWRKVRNLRDRRRGKVRNLITVDGWAADALD